MTRFTYLLVDLFAVIVPFLFSFHPKILFHKKWHASVPAMLITATFFIAWDILFTGWGVWSFNPRYLIGVYFFNIPLEEILFFICIPYACVFTYYCFGLLKSNYFFGRAVLISSIIILVLLFTLTLFFPRLYPTVTFLLLSALILYNEFFRKVKWMKRFYLAYLVLLIPFFICNGILTGTGIDEAVVSYNENEFTGIRLLTIPFEDVFYGMLLIMMNVTIFEYLLQRKEKANI